MSKIIVTGAIPLGGEESDIYFVTWGLGDGGGGGETTKGR